MGKRHGASMPADHNLLGKIIREMREERQLSQEGLAALSNLSRTFIGEVERGDAMLSFSSLALISDGLGYKVSEIVKEYDRRYEQQHS